MNDPYVTPAPANGEDLLVINEGMTLIRSPWRSSYLAWAYKPAIPDSVKIRINEIHAREIDRQSRRT